MPHLLVRVRANGSVVWGWRPLDDNGCTDMIPPLNAGGEVEVDYINWAHWDDRNTSIVGITCNSELVPNPEQCTFEPKTLPPLTLSQGTSHHNHNLGRIQLELHSPAMTILRTSNAAQRIIAFEDYAFSALNALHTRLDPGTYYLRVSHFSGNSEIPYKLEYHLLLDQTP